MHTVIEELVDLLPEWPQRQDWVNALEATLALVYETSPPPPGPECVTPC